MPNGRTGQVPTTHDLHVETLRGIALLLMVAGHVIGASDIEGMRVDDSSAWRLSYDTLIFVRMPLFTVLSGVVYAMRPVTGAAAGQFLPKKVRRLLVPCFVVGGMFYLMQALVPGVNNPPPLAGIWRVVVYSYAHFWFLHALFLVFSLLVLLELTGTLARFDTWLVCMFAAFSAASAGWSPTDLFALNSAIYMLPFFLWGLGIYRFRDVFDRRTLSLATLGVAIVAIVTRQLALLNFVELPVDRQDPITLVAGLAGCAALMRFRFQLPWLASIGYYSYGIYLLHVFGTAGSRMVLKGMHVTSPLNVFLTGMVAGIVCPVVAELFLSKSALARTLVFGRRFEWSRRPGNEPVTTRQFVHSATAVKVN